MKPVLTVYKPLGLTPLQTIHLLKKQYPEYADERIGYAGRLDPMAEGLLLLLMGEENKKKKRYEALPKTYEFEVLFGISTDTYDTLGIITHSDKKLRTKDQRLMTSVMQLIPSLIGKHSQPYPPYASRTVKGIPLYRYAREGRLSDITIPVKEIEIYSLELLTDTSLPADVLQNTVLNRIKSVQGEFRQDKITSSWQSFLNITPLPHFPLLRFRISCSSGTYVRSLANNLGTQLKTGALAYSITRTAIGSYTLQDTVKLDYSI
jgi:tRNA pseudouridine55 synthase